MSVALVVSLIDKLIETVFAPPYSAITASVQRDSKEALVSTRRAGAKPRNAVGLQVEAEYSCALSPEIAPDGIRKAYTYIEIDMIAARKSSGTG
jgi:hypothetical protein